MKDTRLTLVGAGPGAPDLLTLRGLKALQSADVVLYDALVHPELLEHTPSGIPHIFVGKRGGQKYMSQDHINELIVDSAHRYGHVVRLKGGNPFIFGRGQEEIQYAQQAGIPTQVVPGLSSATVGPSQAGIPLTKRGISRSFWVLTATTKEYATSDDLYLAAQSDATMVILMGTRKLSEIVYICSEWRSNDTPIALIERATWEEEKVIFGTLGSILKKAETQQFSSPGIIVIGEVVGLSNGFIDRIKEVLADRSITPQKGL